MKTLQGWNVYKGRRLFDTVYFQKDMTKEEVLSSLINHDSYWAGITIYKDY